MSIKPRADLKPNTADYENLPLVTANGFREYDARWLFGKEINLNGIQALGLGLGTYVHELGIKPRVVTGHNFRVGSYGSYVTPATIDSGGLNLTAGKVLTVAGQQVVGARQTGTPSDATDLASALTLVNALKAKLIAHGLIA